MLETKYFRDYKHSYVILQCDGGQTDNSYQCRLLTSNKIEEILRCSMRHVNGMTYFYYDISSRTTLENLYRGKQMNFGQIRDLFGQLYGIYCRLGDYFMDESKLVLQPEHIYYDLSRKKYIGLYYPDYNEERPFEPLMDYLLEHIDGRDERLAERIYQIYERSEESGFSLGDILQILGEPEETKGRMQESREWTQEPEGKPAEPQVVQGVAAQEPLPVKNLQGGRETGEFLYTGNGFDVRGDKEEAPVSEEPKKKSSFYLVLTIVSVLGLLGIAFVYGSFELAQEEFMMLLGCGALLGICLLAGLVGCLKKTGKKEKENADLNKKDRFDDEMERFYTPQQTQLPLEQVLSREEEPVCPLPQAGFGSGEPQQGFGGRMPQQGFGGYAQQGFDGRAPQAESCTNTVFFDRAKLAERKLYALDKRNKRHIELSKFPFTVGKMAGCVDCVLADDSVSRMHVRFEMAGDVIQMTDMNSTNGTYKNGLRLQPQETVEIEPGDEIRFGNLNYCYR